MSIVHCYFVFSFAATLIDFAPGCRDVALRCVVALLLEALGVLKTAPTSSSHHIGYGKNLRQVVSLNGDGSGTQWFLNPTHHTRGICKVMCPAAWPPYQMDSGISRRTT